MTKLILWIIGLLIAAIVIGALWVTFFTPSSSPSGTLQGQQTTTTLPTGGTNTTVTPPGTSSATTSASQAKQMTVKDQTGHEVIVSDFINNGTTIQDRQNKSQYLLAGNLGYCDSDPKKCQAAPAANFMIYYDTPTNLFSVVLTDEPIGQARSEAENFLMTSLGITQAQMCSLKYLVGVTRYVNEKYAWVDNLGFSFCPGATVLPK